MLPVSGDGTHDLSARVIPLLVIRVESAKCSNSQLSRNRMRVLPCYCGRI